MAELDITLLKNALDALEKAIATYDKYARDDIDLFETLRSGVIQNFEVAYELSWKYMTRYLTTNVTPGIATGLSKREFYRLAAEHALVSDVQLWWDFHEARNRTSHTYVGVTAEDVFVTARRFLPAAREAAARLEKG